MLDNLLDNLVRHVSASFGILYDVPFHLGSLTGLPFAGLFSNFWCGTRIDISYRLVICDAVACLLSACRVQVLLVDDFFVHVGFDGRSYLLVALSFSVSIWVFVLIAFTACDRCILFVCFLG